MKVAILTMFSGLPQTYSLVTVVQEHLQMLLKNDVKVKMIVKEDFVDSEKYGAYLDERIEWVKIKHNIDGKEIKLYDYSSQNMKLHSTFNDEVNLFESEYIKALEDTDVCIMHDILYQGWNYVYNIAIRKAQKSLPKVKFLAFTHSFPVNRPLNIKEEMKGRYTKMDNTVFVYPSNSGLSALANQYNVSEGKCRALYNSPVLIESLSDDVKKLHEKVNLLDSEILIVYPGRFTTGKKFDKVAALAGSIKRVNEKTVKIVFCDFPCLDTPAKEYKNAVYKVADFYGLDANDIVFTSDNGYPNGFPHQGVLDLFTLSNLFICPSLSESFGLTVLEAASRGNFIVLNECVPALEEIGKYLNAYFMKWDAKNYGYDTKQDYFPSERAYYDEHGVEIVKLMREERAVAAKTAIRNRFNLEWIWENQFKPLLEE